jgi:large subunit ribosomal protein L21
VYAIIKEGSGQFKVQTGDVILIDRQGLEQGSDIQFDKVLFVDGRIGSPFVDGASVKGQIKGPSLGEKIYVQKFKRRKKYRRRVGHRQSYTKVEITSIDA